MLKLVALSCREPFLVLHHEKGVLHSHPSLLPKVVCSFHLNMNIVMLSFYPRPQSPVNKALHTLAVVQAVKLYLNMPAAVRKSDPLFILPKGPRKGQEASK